MRPDLSWTDTPARRRLPPALASNRRVDDGCSVHDQAPNSLLHALAQNEESIPPEFITETVHLLRITRARYSRGSRIKLRGSRSTTEA